MADYRKHILEIEQQLARYEKKGLKVISSSSFQTHSIPMLHIISTINNTIPVYFLDTGFHFPETITYKNQISEAYQLNVINLESAIPKNLQRNRRNQFYFVSNPGYCCHLNKVMPMDNVLKQSDVWISGVRRDQSKTRSKFDVEEEGKYDTLRYHPMLEWDNKMIWKYIHDHNIPHHPLEAKGYFSVGCEPCTAASFSMDEDRNGRWAGMNKTECGLHTDLVK